LDGTAAQKDPSGGNNVRVEIVIALPFDRGGESNPRRGAEAISLLAGFAYCSIDCVGDGVVMRIIKTFERAVLCCAAAGAAIGILLATSNAVRPQDREYVLVSGQAFVGRLVSIRVNATTRELEELNFDEPLDVRGWKTLGCRLRLADHPYLQQALERGFLLSIRSETTGCIRSYELGRAESLLPPKPAQPVRTATLTATATGALAPRAPFTPVIGSTPSLAITGTGRLTLRAPFTPVNVRTDALTLIGTGSR
jgi:hypothetical protein